MESRAINNRKESVSFLKRHKFTLYVIYLVLVIFSFSGLCVLLYFSFKPKTIKSVGLSSTTDFDYKVLLKKNNYYETDELGPNMTYIASLIDYIDTSFDYKIVSDDLVDYEVKYKVDAIVQVYGDTSKNNVIYKKQESIIEETPLEQKSSNSIAINKQMRLDYNQYNRMISQFKTSYLLNSDADITLKLHVEAKAKSENIGNHTSFTEDSYLIIPLTKQTIDISLTENTGNIYNVVSGMSSGFVKDKKYFNVAVIDASLLLILIIIKIVFSVSGAKKEAFQRSVKKILKEYDLIIVNVSNGVDESKYSVINVDSFTELKDVHDNIGNPIMFRQVIKNKLCEFTIIKDDILYKYSFKADNV